MTYISVHIDGALDCQDVRVGLLKFSPEEIPVAQISLLAGLQKHPAWALQRLAVVVYAYSQVATRHGYAQIQVSAHGTLVSTETSSNVLLRSVTWHTSMTVRAEAERMIAKLAAPVAWPHRDTLDLQLDASLASGLMTSSRSVP